MPAPKELRLSGGTQNTHQALADFGANEAQMYGPSVMPPQPDSDLANGL